jgi:hypothetical protein
MLTYKTKSVIWDTIAVVSVLLGVLGSMGAWESGSISFIQMLLQVVFFGGFAYTAANTAAAMRRAMRAQRRRARAAVVAHPAVAGKPALRAA